jgi:hypothetical protein
MPRGFDLINLPMTTTDIEKALLKIDEIASNQEGIAAEEALILRGFVALSSFMYRFP